MEDNQYDHIDDYLQIEIYEPKDLNRPNEPKIKGLIADFAILWNLYEKALYKKEHRLRYIKKVIKENHLSEINDIDYLYSRFKEYIQNKYGQFDKSIIANRFNIRVKEEILNDNRIEEKFWDITNYDLDRMIRGISEFDRIYCLLIIVAKVRNNMFHGIKDITELPKQKELFKICNATLISILINVGIIEENNYGRTIKIYRIEQ